MNESTFTIEGAVRRCRSFNRESLMALPVNGRIADLSTVEPLRRGEAVRLGYLLEEAQPDEAATHVTLHSIDGFSASIPLADIFETGLIIFQLDGKELPAAAGGPFRFLIPNAAECRTAELDACANVKALSRVELTTGKGSDTRDS